MLFSVLVVVNSHNSNYFPNVVIIIVTITGQTSRGEEFSNQQQSFNFTISPTIVESPDQE